MPLHFFLPGFHEVGRLFANRGGQRFVSDILRMRQKACALSFAALCRRSHRHPEKCAYLRRMGVKFSRL
jgi:hypothetical protein